MESAEKAGKLMEKLFVVAIEKVETIIDEELKESHEAVAKEIESAFGAAVRKLGYAPSSCAFLSAQVQSGGNFDAK
jgi:hypothetical protein